LELIKILTPEQYDALCKIVNPLLKICVSMKRSAQNPIDPIPNKIMAFCRIDSSAMNVSLLENWSKKSIVSSMK